MALDERIGELLGGNDDRPVESFDRDRGQLGRVGDAVVVIFDAADLADKIEVVRQLVKLVEGVLD